MEFSLGLTLEIVAKYSHAQLLLTSLSAAFQNKLHIIFDFEFTKTKWQGCEFFLVIFPALSMVFSS